METKPFRCDLNAKNALCGRRVCEIYSEMEFIWNLTSKHLVYWTKNKLADIFHPYLCLKFRYDGVTDLSTAESYNPMTNTWQYITPMGTKRSCMGICSFDGLIYVAGGYDGASCLSSFERYDTLTGVWSSCPTMNTRRRYCRLAVVDNCIYALGGFDSSNYQASVEKFDPRVGRWMAVPSMTSRRSSCGVASLDCNLYCIGGNDGTMCMSSGNNTVCNIEF